MRVPLTRAIPFFLAAAVSLPVSSQIRTVPPPVMRNPSSPRPPVGNPEPRPVRPPPVMYTVLAFTVWTGDDDLRSDSIVWVDLSFPDGTTQHCNLRPEHDTWGNNLPHNAPPCVLPAPKRLAQLKATKIDLAYDGNQMAAASQGGDGNLLHSYDNWNVNQVRVIAENPAQHQRICLLNAKGGPLVRMKESNQSFPLSDAWSSC